ncbi:hypothetical protein BLX42_03470 [Pseudomonas sp. SG-MS2]|nr:hypothetical protein BLX42_03470 [Pseudomonas sp. SG-MS2]
MVEHDLAKVGVASSSLVSRSKFDPQCVAEITKKRPKGLFFCACDLAGYLHAGDSARPGETGLTA